MGPKDVMKMLFRKLTKDDYPAANELFKLLDDIHVLARPDYVLPREEVFPQEDYDKWMDDPEGFFLGAFEGNTLAGLVRATLWNKSGMIEGVRVVCLDDIYVQEAYRRQGLGRALFAAVEDWAKKNGAVRLELHCWDFNQRAIAMYREMGMSPQRYVFEKNL